VALKWRGKEVERLLVKASIFAVNKVMSEASIHARNNHPWSNRTGILEGSIRPIVKAKQQGDRVVGVWGSADVNYAIFLELGTKFMDARPYLRPAADVTYPRLKKFIRSAYRRLGKKKAKRR